METIFYMWFIAFFGLLYGLILAWRVLNWAWLKPKKLEKQLRQLGFKGTPYKLFVGNLNEMVSMQKEAKLKPIGLSDDIVPRVVPFDHMCINSYGKNFFAWLGPKPIVNIMDQEIIKEALSKVYQFPKPHGGNPLVKLLARGIADYEGEKWSKHRKIMNPAFHAEKLKHMLPAFYLSCSEMIRKWEKILTSEESCEVDVWPDLQTLSSDAISRTAFGSSYEEGRKVFELQKEQGALAIEAFRSLYIPGSRWLPTKRNKRMRNIAKEVNASIRGMIDNRLMAMQAGGSKMDDLLGIMLDSNQKEIKQGNKNSGMTIDEIIEECKLLYIAGQETTSNLLVWTMILLSQYPYWQSQARDEVFQVFGNKTPDVDGLNRLKVVTMILHEVLRLYPPAVGLARTLQEEAKIGEKILPAEVILSFPIMLLHHDKELWGDDAKEFKPERFATGVSNATKGQLSYFPFGWGPRICIGQNFAMIESKMALAIILQQFSFSLSPSYSHAPYVFLTHQPQHGAQLILQKL